MWNGLDIGCSDKDFIGKEGLEKHNTKKLMKHNET